MAIGRISGQMLKSNLLRSGTDLAFETNLLVLDVSNSRIGIGTASPATKLHVNGTDSVRLPAGTTAQRPSTPANGDIRYNSTLNQLEAYANGAWANLASGTVLIDADEDTKVEVERTSDEDTIRFATAGTDRAKILADGTIELNNLSLSGQTITGIETNGDITLTPNGTGVVVASTGLSLNDQNITNVGDINVDTISSDNGTDFDITLDDNQANALEIKEGSTAYLNFATTDSSELITANVAMTIASGNTFTTATADINGGAIDGTAIGANSASTGSFTTLETTGNATIGGDLTVNGTTTTIDSETLVIEDPLLTLAKNNSGGAANTFDQGLFFNRGSDDNVSFLWDESADEFVFAVTSSEDGTTAGNVTIDSYADVQFKDATLNKATFDGITIEDADILGTASNQNINITPNGTGSVVIAKADINGGNIDSTVIGATTAAAGTFTNLTANGVIDIDSSGNIDGIVIGGSTAAAGSFTTATATDVQATNIKANDGTAAISIADSTGAVTITTDVELDGGNVTINESSASVDFRVESNDDTHALFVDGSENHVGIRTSSPAYDLDLSGSTDAVRLPTGTTAQRPTAATGIIRFNSTLGKYEVCQDGSTFIELATAGDTPIFSKATATGDGSTTTFTGFFASAPANANNVFVYIDNVYQEPTENYTVSSTNITFTSAPHSSARIFAITGADNTALVSAGVARTETSSTDVSGSSAVDIFTFNANDYRAAEAFIIAEDSGNTNYEVAKAHIVHDGTTAYVTVYGTTNSSGTDLAAYSVTMSGSTVKLQATANNSGTLATKVQYSLA